MGIKTLPSENDNQIHDPVSIERYNIKSMSIDFTLSTLVRYLDDKVITIHNFHRYYSWNIKQASSLIESLLIGLPIPQLFIFKNEANNYVLVDGIHRLLTFYFFIKGVFPVDNINARMNIQDNYDKLQNIVNDKSIFTEFKLDIKNIDGTSSRYDGMTYKEIMSEIDLSVIKVTTLESYNDKLNLNDIMFEIFNRLNVTYSK